ncbi:hypothetical protein ACH5RR_015301 [Cinchona calisaya]|uniref:Uncharacterized protein n=1 Tax=Cinchona calisaya TaxID=153742 RepID=A0ABD2ZWB4_9GENT
MNFSFSICKSLKLIISLANQVHLSHNNLLVFSNSIQIKYLSAFLTYSLVFSPPKLGKSIFGNFVPLPNSLLDLGNLYVSPCLLPSRLRIDSIPLLPFSSPFSLHKFNTEWSS